MNTAPSEGAEAASLIAVIQPRSISAPRPTISPIRPSYLVGIDEDPELGVRPNLIASIALVLEDASSGAMRSRERFGAEWHGHVTEPKTRKSKGAIPVIAPLAKRLEIHRTRMGDPTSGPMFPNEARKPTDLNNLLNRVILPTLNRCAECGEPRSSHVLSEHEFERDKSLPEWHGWHAARRGLGTNLYRLGVPEKTIQAILRHANVSTTNTYYIKTAAADAQAAMAKLENEIMGNEWAIEPVPPQTTRIQ
jgi:hypothetical protein